jgi:hypothetical protein
VQVTIGGEPRTLGGFSAFKAFYAMQVLADAERIGRQVLDEAADFKRGYEARNFVEMDRAEARRQFAPEPMTKRIRREIDDTGRLEVIDEPVRDDDGQIVMLDPLAHLTDADWANSDQKLRVPDSPSSKMQIAAMIPIAFRQGRREVLRLLALIVTSNADLERWDSEGDVDVELEKIAGDLLHRASIEALELCREQIAGPFDRLMREVQTTFARRAPDEDERPAPPPAAFETEDETPASPTSSTESPDGTAGTPSSSSTEPVFVS